MCQQDINVLKYNNKKYNIIMFSCNVPFSRSDYDLPQQNIEDTGCYDGYSAEYSIKNGFLQMDTLYLCQDLSEEKKAKRSVLSRLSVKCHRLMNKLPSFRGRKKLFHDAYYYSELNDRMIFKDVKLIIPYSGNILVGRGLRPGSEISLMGIFPPSAYREVREFRLSRGKLKCCRRMKYV